MKTAGPIVRVFLVAAAIAAAGLVSGSSPAGAGDAPDFDLPGEMAEFWASRSGQELIAEYTVDPATVSDPPGDFEFSSGEPPGLAPTPELDILTARTFVFTQPDDLPPMFDTEANGGIFCEANPFSPVVPGVRTLCPAGGFDPAAFADGALVSVIETNGEFGLFNLTRTCEWVMWMSHPGRIGFQELPQFPLDPARGTDSAVGLRIGTGESGPFSLDLTDGGSFAPGSDDPLVAIGQNQIAFFTPLGEAGVPNGGRAYTFCTEGGFQASDSVADSTSFFDILIEIEPGHLVLLAPPPIATTTSTVAETTTSALAPSTTEAVAAAPPPAVAESATPSTEATLNSTTTEPPNSEGGSFSSRLLIPLIVGGIVIIVAITVYWRTRERRRDVGGTRVRRPAVPAATPGGARHPGAHDHDQDGCCDWALYVDDGGTRRLIRPADGHECCVYDISLVTGIWAHDEVARGRQDADSPASTDASAVDRLRLPDLDWGIAGALWGWAAARSGPAGRLDWMQALGDRRQRAGRVVDQLPGAQHEQLRSHEESPDVAAHLTHIEWLDVDIKLTPGCPKYHNTYTVNGTSEVTAEASHECTNSAPGPECPIEFTSAASVEVSVIGDLAYATHEVSGSDVDEIEPIAERFRKQIELAGPVTMTDSHDHVTRSRDTVTSSRSASGAAVVTTETLLFTVWSALVLDAGTIVPVSTWPHVERATADIYGEVSNDLRVDGHMDPECGADACGGHGHCQCHPDFQLHVESRVATLTVDGTTYTLTRPTVDGAWNLS